MKESSLRIKRGAVYRISVSATTESVVSSATVWTLYDDREQTLKTVLSAGDELLLGPYLNITRFRIQEIGSVTIEEIGDDFSVPTSLFAHQDMDLGVFGLTAIDVNTKTLTLGKEITGGIKVDTENPTFGWKDIIGDIVPKDSGANTPVMAAFIGNVRTWSYNVNDIMDMVFHIPHDYVLGTDLFIHVHWSHNGTAISGSLVNTFEHTYAKSHNQEIYVATKTITQTIGTPDIATIPQYIHRLDEVQLSSSGGSATLMDSDDLEPDGVIVILFKPTTIPTITGGSPNNFPRITQIDLHYQATNITTKNKEPNFYV